MATYKTPANTTYEADAPQSVWDVATNEKLNPTVVSNLNKIKEVPSIIDKTNKLSDIGVRTNNSGTQTYANGEILPIQKFSDGSTYDPNTGQTTPATINKLGSGLPNKEDQEIVNPSKTTTGGYYGDIYYAPGSEIPKDDSGNLLTLSDTSTTDAKILKSLEDQKSQADALTADMISSIQSQYARLKQQQEEVNKGQQARITSALLTGGVTGKGSSAQYAPISSEGIIGAQINYGIQQIADLTALEQNAIAQARAAGQKQKFDIQDKLNQKIEQIREEKQKAADELNKKILEENKKMKEKIIQSSRDDAVTSLYMQGITNPSQMLNYLNYDEQGNKIGDFSIKEISDTIQMIKPAADELNRRTAAIKFAAENGINKPFYLIGNTAIDTTTGQPVSLEEYQKATGQQVGLPESKTNFSFIQTLTDPQVKQLMEKYPDSGITQTDNYSQAVDKVKKNSAIYRKDVNIASSGGGSGLGDLLSIISSAGETPIDANSQSILIQAGLSLPAFNYLTQGTSALTRLSAKDRSQIMKEAQDWANKKGIDISTFQSRFKAYNDTLQKNIERFNNSAIMEGELKGTIENLSEVADAKNFGKLKVKNVIKLFAGEQLNDPTTLQYAVHLNQLVSELAGYNAAVQGRTSTDLVDIEEAKRVIKNGVSSGSLQGFKNALESSVDKMGKTLQSSVDRSNKQVWDLFGVGEKYKSSSNKNNTVILEDPKTKERKGFTGLSDSDIQDAIKQGYKLIQ